MSAYHALEQTGFRLRIVHHFATPSGNNSAGVTWKAAALAAGLSGTTRLTEGTGPGQISTTEKAQVTAGDVLEIEFTVDLSLTLTGAQVLAAVQEVGTTEEAGWLARTQAQLKYYGGTA